MTAETVDILTNKEVIAINQDALGLQAFVVWKSDKVLPISDKRYPAVPLQSVWAGPLENGAFTALLLNMDSKPAKIKLTRAMLKKSIMNAPAGTVAPPAK